MSNTKGEEVKGWTWVDKWVMITGAGSGLGRELAVQLAGKGVEGLCLADVAEEGLQTTRGLCGGGVKVVTKVFDVRDARAFEEAVKGLPRLDVLYNNAGVLEGAFSFGELSAADVQRIVDVDLTSVLCGTAIALRAMGERGGVVVNTASMAALLPTPAAPVYAASKSAVAHFTRSLAYLHPSRNVRVLAVCPSYTETPMVFASADPARLQEMRQEVGGRLLLPSEVVHGMIDIVQSAPGGSLMRITVRGGQDYWPRPRQARL